MNADAPTASHGSGFRRPPPHHLTAAIRTGVTINTPSPSTIHHAPSTAGHRDSGNLPAAIRQTVPNPADSAGGTAATVTIPAKSSKWPSSFLFPEIQRRSQTPIRVRAKAARAIPPEASHGTPLLTALPRYPASNTGQYSVP